MNLTAIDKPLDFSIEESFNNTYFFGIRGKEDIAIVKMSETDIYDLIELLEATVEKFHT